MENIRKAIENFYATLGQDSYVPVVVICIAIILISGFLMTRLTKLLKLPNVTAYIAVGILIGPFCFGLVTDKVINGMEFITDIATAFIAFGAGRYFRLDVWKKNGVKAIIITLIEALLTSILTFTILFFILRMDWKIALLLASIASASTPTSTMVTIRQYKAKGKFVDILLQVMALDIAISLITYSIAMTFVTSASSTTINVLDIVLPLVYNFSSILIGAGCGFLLKFLIPTKRTTDNRLIIVIAVLFGFCGLVTSFNVSPLLGCMAIGMVYINLTNDDKLFKQVNYFTPPFLLCFFVKSGMTFDITKLASLGLVGLVYFLVRNIGKYCGGILGSVVTKQEKKTRYLLGLTLFPQASIAISLAALSARTIGGELGDKIQIIILSSALLNEFIGPALSKLALQAAGTFSINTDEEKETPSILLNRTLPENKSLDQIIKEHLEKINNTNEQMTDEEAVDELLEEDVYSQVNSKQLHTRH